MMIYEMICDFISYRPYFVARRILLLLFLLCVVHVVCVSNALKKELERAKRERRERERKREKKWPPKKGRPTPK
jgi:hypothetical protein